LSGGAVIKRWNPSFSVIEMATPSEKPARSKRRIIAAGSGFAGLGELHYLKGVERCDIRMRDSSFVLAQQQGISEENN
jgi:hypothetical protein